MRDDCRKPDLLFVVRSALDAAATRARFELGAAEGWESDRLIFVPESELASGVLARPELPLTPVTRAAIECFAGRATIPSSTSRDS